MLLTRHVDPNELAPLVPDVWSQYRLLIVHTLQRFVELLPVHRREEIACAQSKLAPDAAISQRLAVLLADCPTLHKLGQMIARDQRLSPELRVHLQWLERMTPTLSSTELRHVLHAELGDRYTDDIQLAAQPLAEGSVAVVQPFLWHNQEYQTDVRGVFKILKPGIEQRLEEDLDVWEQLAEDILDDVDRLPLSASVLRDLIADVRDLLAHEIRLDVEQRNLALAADQFANHSGVFVPCLLPFCTSRVTAMEHVDGQSLADVASLTASQQSRLATLLIEGCITIPLWTSSETSLFHGDPHAGNFVWTHHAATGSLRLGMLDWSLAANLRSSDVRHLSRVFVALATNDFRPLCIELEGLGARITDMHTFSDIYAKVREGRESGNLPRLTTLVALIDTAIQRDCLSCPASLLILRKSLLTLQGVTGTIRPEIDIDLALLSLGLVKWLSEWPERAFVAPTYDQIGTRLSNSDVWRMAMQQCLGPYRWWTQSVHSLMRGLLAGSSATPISS